MKSGYTLVFGGPDFRPEDFLRSCPRLAALADGERAEDSWLEFADIHDGTYPMDAATEALDFIRSYREEFMRLSHFAGVATRALNFFGDAESCSFELDPSDIALLHELSLCVSICPV